MKKQIIQKNGHYIRTIEIASLVTLLFVTNAIFLSNNIAFATGIIPEHPVTIHFEANITQIIKLDDYPDLSKSVHMGDHIIGSVTYDLVTPDDSATVVRNGTYGYFSPSPFDITMKVNNFAFGTNPFKTIASIFVTNMDKIPDDQTPTDNTHTDQIAIVSRSEDPNITVNHSPIDGMGIFEITIYFNDRTGNAISSDAQPPYAPDLNVWPEHFIGINGHNDHNDAFIGANIISTW